MWSLPSEPLGAGSVKRGRVRPRAEEGACKAEGGGACKACKAEGGGAVFRMEGACKAEGGGAQHAHVVHDVVVAKVVVVCY